MKWLPICGLAILAVAWKLTNLDMAVGFITTDGIYYPQSPVVKRPVGENVGCHVKGSHVESYCLSEVILCMCCHYGIDMPYFKQMPKLLMFEARYFEIDEFDGNTFDFNPKSNMKSLTLFKGNVTKIKKIPYPELEELIVKRNNLTEIEDNAFESLGNLITADFHCNSIRQFKDKSFFGLTNLTKLIVHHNLLEKLPPDFWKQLPKLKTLDISYNEIHTVEEWKFEHTHSSLQELILEKNHLKTLSASTLKQLPELKILNAKSNLITAIDMSVPFRSKLEVLDLSENKLQYLDAKSLMNFPHLKALDVSSNEIKKLPSGIFDYTPMLINLTASDCSLVELPQQLFRNTKKLQYLNIEGNKGIENLADTFFEEIQDLRVFNASRIGLKSLPTSLVVLKKLQHLLLNQVGLPCDCSMQWITLLDRKPMTIRNYNVEIDQDCENPLGGGKDNIRNIMKGIICGPKIASHTADQSYLRDQTVNLTCVTSTFPKPSLAWILPSGRKLIHLERPDFVNIKNNVLEDKLYGITLNPEENMLTIPKLSTYTEGIYQCIVANGVGTSTQNISVTLDKERELENFSFKTEYALTQLVPVMAALMFMMFVVGWNVYDRMIIMTRKTKGQKSLKQTADDISDIFRAHAFSGFRSYNFIFHHALDVIQTILNNEILRIRQMFINILVEAKHANNDIDPVTLDILKDDYKQKMIDLYTKMRGIVSGWVKEYENDYYQKFKPLFSEIDVTLTGAEIIELISNPFIDAILKCNLPIKEVMNHASGDAQLLFLRGLRFCGEVERSIFARIDNQDLFDIFTDIKELSIDDYIIKYFINPAETYDPPDGSVLPIPDYVNEFISDREKSGGGQGDVGQAKGIEKMKQGKAQPEDSAGYGCKYGDPRIHQFVNSFAAGLMNDDGHDGEEKEYPKAGTAGLLTELAQPE